MGKTHDHGKNKGFANGHETLTVTVTYAGHPQAIDDALHGATRETEWAKAELDKADATIDALTDANYALSTDLYVVTMAAEGLADELNGALSVNESLRAELVTERKYGSDQYTARWAAEDAKRAAERREADTRIKFQGEVANRDSTIAKLQKALSGLTTGEYSVEEFAAFVASREKTDPAAFDVNKPVVNYEFEGASHSGNPNYPFALLKGDKESVRKQILACFVDDPEHREKIQAIKMVRTRTGLGLKEAKDLVEWATGLCFTDR